jgi:uncharacterized FAD-dependent dehydrogenase
MRSYDCAIVGSGPAGLGAAFEILARRPDARVLILEREKVSSGGLRNDCKMNFSWPIGFPTEYWPVEVADAYLRRVEDFLQPTILPQRNISTYERRASRIGVQLLKVRQSHLGTDGGLELIKSLLSRLSGLGAEISLEEELISIDRERKTARTSKGEFEWDQLVVAPGRHGFDFLRGFMRENAIEFSDNSIDVGVRVETRAEHYPIVKDYYDPKFLFPERTRTFCTNSGAAHVVQERYLARNGETYYSVNGHAYSAASRANGLVNFAVLRSVEFTQPLASGQDYAEFLASLAMLTGGGHPIMQRIGDFRLGKRTTRDGLNDDLYDFEPSLASCTPGDISLAMPAKFLRSIWKALKQLDTIVPGVLHPATILYYPEIKLYANKPRFLDANFQAADGIYLVGDGAGTSRGITAAWASGMRAADGIAARKGW